MRPLILEQLLKLSVKFNGIYVPGKELEKTLSRFTQMVFVGTQMPNYPVILRGSATTIRFLNRDLLVCTQHQIADVDWQNVGMMAEGGQTFVTSGGHSNYSISTDTDAFDIVAFNFSEPVAGITELRSRFLNLTNVRPLEQEILGVLVVGFPYADQVYDVGEHNNHISQTKRLILCKPDSEFPSDTALVRVTPMQPLQFDADGMSGGTAFLLLADGSDFTVAFGGMVVRGGREGFYILKPGLFVDFLGTVTAT